MQSTGCDKMDLSNDSDSPGAGRRDVPVGGGTVVSKLQASGDGDCAKPELDLEPTSNSKDTLETRPVETRGEGGSCHKQFSYCHVYRALLDNDVTRMAVILASGEVDVNAMYHFTHADRKKLRERLLSMNVGQCVPEYTILHVCCACDNVPMLDVVLRHEPDLNALATTGESALHLACMYGNAACVISLLLGGATVNVRSADGRVETPLTTAVTCFALSVSGDVRDKIR